MRPLSPFEETEQAGILGNSKAKRLGRNLKDVLGEASETLITFTPAILSMLATLGFLALGLSTVKKYSHIYAHTPPSSQIEH